MTSSRAPLSDHPLRAAQSGVTLIEMLIVLAVIGVAAGATMMGVNAANRDTGPQTEAVRLARYITLALDEALLSGRPYLLIWDAAGYHFAPMTDDPVSALLAQDHRMSGGVALSTPDASGTSSVILSDTAGASVRFEITGAGPTWQVAFDGFKASPQRVELQ